MDKQILKQILRDNQQEVERYVVEPRELVLSDFPGVTGDRYVSPVCHLSL